MGSRGQGERGGDDEDEEDEEESRKKEGEKEGKRENERMRQRRKGTEREDAVRYDSHATNETMTTATSVFGTQNVSKIAVATRTAVVTERATVVLFCKVQETE